MRIDTVWVRERVMAVCSHVRNIYPEKMLEQAFETNTVSCLDRQETKHEGFGSE